jgi:hypothetical protein
MTYSELVEKMEKQGCNLASVAVGRMMVEVEERTGDFLSWNEIAPQWVVDNCR